MKVKNTKIVVIRTTCADVACAPAYTVDLISGSAEVEIPARFDGQVERTLMVGDRLSHEELKRLTTVKVYVVKVRAQKV